MDGTGGSVWPPIQDHWDGFSQFVIRAMGWIDDGDYYIKRHWIWEGYVIRFSSSDCVVSILLRSRSYVLLKIEKFNIGRSWQQFSHCYNI